MTLRYYMSALREIRSVCLKWTFGLNLIPVEIYSSVVAVAVITTLIFPIILRYYLKKDPSIMN